MRPRSTRLEVEIPADVGVCCWNRTIAGLGMRWWQTSLRIQGLKSSNSSPAKRARLWVIDLRLIPFGDQAPFSYQVPLEDTGDIKLVARLATVGGNPAVVFLYDGGRRFSVTQYKPPSDWQPGPPGLGARKGTHTRHSGDGAWVQTLVAICLRLS